MLANCPLVWASRLQSTIALSIQNAEYVALSQSLRELVSIRELLLDLVGTLVFCEGARVKNQVTPHIDNKNTTRPLDERQPKQR
jgi:hypothetical protein